MNRIEYIKAKMKEIFRGMSQEPFRPLAFYDKVFDRILIQTRDCSIMEVRINEILTMLEDNYPEASENKHVGFAIECASAFCTRYGLLSDRTVGTVSLNAVLDSLCREFPGNSSAIDTARGILNSFNLDAVKLT